MRAFFCRGLVRCLCVGFFKGGFLGVGGDNAVGGVDVAVYLEG